MAFHTLLAALSGLSMIVTTQEASLDTQLATPVLASARISAPQVDASNQTSVHFRDAKLADVLAWMDDHGVSYVLASGDVPGDTRISLNVRNASVDTIADAIAKALGGHWNRENGVRVFRRDLGDGPPRFGFDASPSPFASADLERKIREETDQIQRQFGPDFEKRIQERADQMAKQFGPDFQKQIQRQSEEMQKEFGPDFPRKIKEQADQMAKKFGPDFQKQMEGQAKEWAKQAEAWKKQAEQWKGLGNADSKWKWLGPTGDGPSMIRPSGGTGGSAHSVDIDRLMRSLTDNQRDIMSKRGFVWWDDLTRDQQELLGPRPKGHFELKYKLDDRELVVRGN